jgi:DNA repair protein RadC
MTTAPGDKFVVRSPADIAQLLMAEMSYLEQEHFKVLTLDTRNRVLADTTLHISAVSTPVTSVWARCFGRP